MALTEKKKKAIAAAVVYFLEQEAAQQKQRTPKNMWVSLGKETIMQNRTMVQRRGRMLSIA